MIAGNLLIKLFICCCFLIERQIGITGEPQVHDEIRSREGN